MGTGKKEAGKSVPNGSRHALFEMVFEAPKGLEMMMDLPALDHPSWYYERGLGETTVAMLQAANKRENVNLGTVAALVENIFLALLVRGNYH